jgi:hypothetical protein
MLHLTNSFVLDTQNATYGRMRHLSYKIDEPSLCECSRFDLNWFLVKKCEIRGVIGLI